MKKINDKSFGLLIFSVLLGYFIGITVFMAGFLYMMLSGTLLAVFVMVPLGCLMASSIGTFVLVISRNTECKETEK